MDPPPILTIVVLAFFFQICPPLTFERGSNENRALFYAKVAKLPPASDLAEQAEEERRAKRSRAKEEEEGGGIRSKVDKRLRSGGEMRPGEEKVREEHCRSGLRRRRLQNMPAGEEGGDN